MDIVEDLVVVKVILEVTRVALHQSFNHHSEVLVVGPDLDAVVVDLVPVLYPLWNSLVLNSAWQKKKRLCVVRVHNLDI
ncbi:putative 40S ribosomal protein S10 [Iris pallida]|uniref:40S ribosomal protein S10 n=1 Tax=Iris pallida TaxID=29817 RepID=A0AAX6IKQ9_IRIPA|nr:putative 40S ribosomal protein S10 [Iris pallida]